MKKFLHLLPRILAILFICFVSLFALDAFGQPQWFLALAIHLIPSFILVVVTMIAWKNELVGGLLFVVAGGMLLLMSSFESLIVSVPAFVIGGLFLVGRRYGKST